MRQLRLRGLTERRRLPRLVMDARVKPAHDAAFVAPSCQMAKRHRPYSLSRPRAGPRLICLPALEQRTEGARNATGPEDPRASTPRDIEACRRPVSPQVRLLRGVPRAVFIGLLRIAPGGLTVSGDPASLLDWKAAYPPLNGPNGAQHFRPCRRPSPVGPAWRAAGAPGRSGLDRRPRKPRRISDAPEPATAPRPVSEDACADTPRYRGGMDGNIV